MKQDQQDAFEQWHVGSQKMSFPKQSIGNERMQMSFLQQLIGNKMLQMSFPQQSTENKRYIISTAV